VPGQMECLGNDEDKRRFHHTEELEVNPSLLSGLGHHGQFEQFPGHVNQDEIKYQRSDN